MSAPSPAHSSVHPPARTFAEFMASFSPRTLFLMLGLVTIPVLILDQLSKRYVAAHMQLYENLTLVPNWLDLTYALNSGAAFSMFTGLPEGFRRVMLFGFSAAAMTVLLVLIAFSEAPSVTSFALALILAGAGGNFIDRVTRGGMVVDFVRAHYYSHNWPIFNVADSAISVGVTLILLSSFFPRRPQ